MKIVIIITLVILISVIIFMVICREEKYTARDSATTLSTWLFQNGVSVKDIKALYEKMTPELEDKINRMTDSQIIQFVKQN